MRARDTRRRDAELRLILEDRRRQLTVDRQAMMQAVRTRSADDHDVTDMQDVGAADVRDDLELALLQMKTETLRKIEAALQRLDEGTYGYCTACASPIAAARLRALPFAVRCTACESARERPFNPRPTASSRYVPDAIDRIE